MVGAATSSTHTSALPSLLLESIVTSTKISVMPSVSSQNNSTTNSPAASSPSGYTNISSAGQSTTLRFDRHVVPNYSSNFMSSSLTSPSCKSSTVVGRQIGDIPALPLQLFNCEQCGRSYACEYTLRRHIRLECGKEATLQCPLCPRRTKHKHSLLRHINKFHPGSNEAWAVTKWPSEFMGCSDGHGNVIVSSAGGGDILVNQLPQSSQFKPFHCDMCGASYSQRRSLLAHKRRECGKEATLQCPLCLMKTKRKGNLKRHILFVHTKL